jgi:hypothetical protein
MEKEEKEKVKEKNKENVKEEKEKSIWSLQAISLLLLIILIALVLIVIQVPYTTTNAIKENVSVENCEDIEIPFVANFRTGLKYAGASNVESSEGVALYRYSDLGPYMFANIRNIGEDRGVYCLKVDAYFIKNFEEGENALDSFNEIAEDSELVQELTDELNVKYTFPVCTENLIRPIQTDVLSIWSSSILSEEAKDIYDLDDVYVLFSVISPTAEKCVEEEIEQEVEQEVTRYCNAWKHVVGRC